MMNSARIFIVSAACVAGIGLLAQNPPPQTPPQTPPPEGPAQQQNDRTSGGAEVEIRGGSAAEDVLVDLFT